MSALAPAGTLLVVAHDVTNLTDGYGGPQDPKVLYTPDQVVSSLDGLVIDKAERVRRPVQADQEPSMPSTPSSAPTAHAHRTPPSAKLVR